MAKTITTRLPDEYVSRINKIADIEKLDTSGVIRKLLARAMEEWRKDYAIEKYKKEEFSFSEAAKFAGISVWDFPSLLKQRKVPINMNEEELEFDLKTIKWKSIK